MLTVAEVASILRVCKATVYRMVNDGELVAVRVVNSVRIPPSALNALGFPPVREIREPLPPLDERAVVVKAGMVVSEAEHEQ